jgi:hypothetical protein
LLRFMTKLRLSPRVAAGPRYTSQPARRGESGVPRTPGSEEYMKGRVRLQHEMEWDDIEYVPVRGGILITDPMEVVRKIWGFRVNVQLQDGSETAGDADRAGQISF